MTPQQEMEFLSTPSARRATGQIFLAERVVVDFYPRPPRGGRLLSGSCFPSLGNFYPRPPRGGRPARSALCTTSGPISIHALREEGDELSADYQGEWENFYPRPPRGGRPTWFTRTPARWTHFYPRPPRGGRRGCPWRNTAHSWNFYPRPPRGGRQSGQSGPLLPLLFLSTPSARRATAKASIREIPKNNFYPRPPRGGRPWWTRLSLRASRFLSTPSARRATGTFHGASRNTPYFYPRPPRGGRPSISKCGLRQEHFYPRPPRGGRPDRPAQPGDRGAISIHALREEGDFHPR